MTKPRPISFSGNISPAQTQQLIEWLAEHTYSETRDLIALDPPDGFGLDISIPTISRFYKANQGEINELRQKKLASHAGEQWHYACHRDDLYRSNIDKGSTLCLQERLYELLLRPVETVDDLKKLVYICKEMKSLDIPLDPQEAQKDELLKKLLGHPVDQLLASRKAARKAAQGSAAVETHAPPADGPE